MWASPGSSSAAPAPAGGSSAAVSSVDLLFPPRPRRASPSASEQRRRPLPPPVSTGVSNRDLWAYDGQASAKSPSGLASSATHGVIGSSDAGARLLWNRPAPEEEEREEEALPSYLSYLQPHASPRSLDAPSALQSSSLSLSMAPSSVSSAPTPTQDDVEAKSRALAHALEELVRTQLQGIPAAPAPSTRASCDCDALKTRVEALERQLTALQTQKTQEAEATSLTQTLTDRVSTLEGRQSAFQSQLAQISKVLGVPVGKAGKHSQLKTLVQTLHEELDTKLEEVAAEMKVHCEAKCAEEVAKALEAQPSQSREAEGTALPYATVLGALAEEHEAALARLNAHVDERLRLESSQRVALEGRVYARQAEQEEWLQQLEGACSGSRFEGSATSTDVSRELEELSTQLKALALQVEEVQSETRETSKSSKGLKQLVEKLVRDTGSAETLLQQYVSTITHQVASVTRQYVSVRIRDNNRLLDATLRARVPAYARNESDGLLLVRPEPQTASSNGAEDEDGAKE